MPAGALSAWPIQCAGGMPHRAGSTCTSLQLVAHSGRAHVQVPNGTVPHLLGGELPSAASRPGMLITLCLTHYCLPLHVPGSNVPRLMEAWQCLYDLVSAPVQVLGGTVPHLVEAWQFQRKYGSLSRLAAVPDGLDQPPPFQNFIPGRCVTLRLSHEWSDHSRRHA